MPARKTVKVVAERTEICKNCKAADFAEVITCHRLPPQNAVDGTGAHVDTYFPVVRVTDWCLEFKPKLDS